MIIAVPMIEIRLLRKCKAVISIEVMVTPRLKWPLARDVSRSLTLQQRLLARFNHLTILGFHVFCATKCFSIRVRVNSRGCKFV